jgi:hypothetical protein
LENKETHTPELPKEDQLSIKNTESIKNTNPNKAKKKVIFTNPKTKKIDTPKADKKKNTFASLLDSTSDSGDFEKEDIDLIYDFTDQVNIIDLVVRDRERRQKEFIQFEKIRKRKSKKGSKGNKPPKCIYDKSDFESTKFAKFFFDTTLKDMKKTEGKDTSDLRLKFFSPKNQDQMEVQENWSFGIMSLCKSLHFFNMKKIMLSCIFCGKFFSNHGMGGHMSKIHPKRSANFQSRQTTKDARTIARERNQLVRLAPCDN